jgi:hypothetical protein
MRSQISLRQSLNGVILTFEPPHHAYTSDQSLAMVRSESRAILSKVQVSRLEEQNTIEKALKLLNLIKSRKFAEAFENGTSTIELLRLTRTYEKAFNVLQTAL